MVYDRAKQLADEMRQSDEYRAYCAAKERAYSAESTRNLLSEYHRLRTRAQAYALSGERNDALLAKLQKLGELLQFDADAAEYLLAEYRLTEMLGDVYKILAQAVEMDIGDLEA